MSETPQKMKAVGPQEIIVGRILRLGVIISFTLVVIGAIVTFASPTDRPTAETLAVIRGHDKPPADETPTPKTIAAHFPSSLTDIFRDSLSLRGPAIVMLGIVVLVATPVMRVATAIVLFAIERDKFYVATTTIVLLLLIVSLLLGKGA